MNTDPIYECGSVITATSPGLIQSLNYPNNYPADLSCEFLFDFEEGRSVGLVFQALQASTKYDSTRKGKTNNFSGFTSETDII